MYKNEKGPSFCIAANERPVLTNKPEVYEAAAPL